MPGFGSSTVDDGVSTGINVQADRFVALLEHLNLVAPPHVLAHDIGAAVTLRANLLHKVDFSSIVLADPVSITPWGSGFFRLVKDHADTFLQLPANLHSALIAAYIKEATVLLDDDEFIAELTSQWTGSVVRQNAFYKQICDADESFTEEFRELLPDVDMPIAVIWGKNDNWIPESNIRNLVKEIGTAELSIIDSAGHLVFRDQPEAFELSLLKWYRANGIL